MGKNILKFNGKSGILPKTKAIFKAPIRPKLEFELAKDENIEQGYKNVPVPKIEGINKTKDKFTPVSELIQRISYPDRSLSEINKIEDKNERDFLKRAYFRADFLKDSYIEEEKRLHEIDQMKQKIFEKRQINEQKAKIHHKSDSANDLLKSLPSLTNLLSTRMIDPISEEERSLIKQQKKLNRNLIKLDEKSKKLERLLKLYHSSNKFIINEEQLEDAIYKAFEVNVSDYESRKNLIEAKLNGREPSYIQFENNQSTIKDFILGEIDGKPGLEQIKDSLNGNKEEYKRQAQSNNM